MRNVELLAAHPALDGVQRNALRLDGGVRLDLVHAVRWQGGAQSRRGES